MRDGPCESAYGSCSPRTRSRPRSRSRYLAAMGLPCVMARAISPTMRKTRLPMILSITGSTQPSFLEFLLASTPKCLKTLTCGS